MTIVGLPTFIKPTRHKLFFRILVILRLIYRIPRRVRSRVSYLLPIDIQPDISANLALECLIMHPIIKDLGSTARE